MKERNTDFNRHILNKKSVITFSWFSVGGPLKENEKIIAVQIVPILRIIFHYFQR